jgi:hypothetical protein
MKEELELNIRIILNKNVCIGGGNKYHIYEFGRLCQKWSLFVCQQLTYFNFMPL